MTMPQITNSNLYKIFLTACLPVALLACSQEQEQPQPPSPEVPPASTALAFEGARLIVGNGTVIENATFIVDGGQFLMVGNSPTVEIPAGATTVDLNGATVMPAIIDTHTHLSQTRDALIEDLRRKAYFGTGAVLSLGQDAGETPFQVRGEVITGAALYRTAGRGMTAPEPGRSEIPHWVSSPEEARAAVREEAALGADIIKIWVDDRGGQYEKLAPDLYRAVIDEAHQNGLRVTAHIFELADAKELLRAGVDAFAHGVRDRDVDDEFMALVAERPDFVLVPNMGDRGVETDYSWLRGHIPDEQLEQLQASDQIGAETQEAWAIQARNLERMNDAGVFIALGTDGNTPWAAHFEMEDMVAAGMTPAEVLVASTANAADFLQLENTGTIETGKSADFIVLDANPLEDITYTRAIRDVYLRGERIDRAE